MVGVMTMVEAPTVVQATPSRDWKAVKVFPLRVSFRKKGATPAAPGVLIDSPPADVRRWKASPLPGLTNMAACAAPGSSACRIITPALVQALTFWTVVTCVTIEPSPVSGR